VVNDIKFYFAGDLTAKKCHVKDLRDQWRQRVPNVGGGISGHNHRGAEGAEIEIDTPRRRGGGELGGSIPLPSRLGGLGERRELPQQGPGRSPGRKRIFAHLDIERRLPTTVNEMKIHFMPCTFVTCQ